MPKKPKGAIPVNYTSVTDWHDGIMWFKAYSFKFVQREKALLRIPVGEKFSTTEWVQFQIIIVRNLHSYLFLKVIPV